MKKFSLYILIALCLIFSNQKIMAVETCSCSVVCDDGSNCSATGSRWCSCNCVSFHEPNADCSATIVSVSNDEEAALLFQQTYQMPAPTFKSKTKTK